MNKIPNRQAICETLMAHAATDKDIVVLCSDSRGSASLSPFFKEFPEQSVEVGIAEQNLVSISAGLAACGKKPWCASPASFVSTRSYEQCKVAERCPKKVKCLVLPDAPVITGTSQEVFDYYGLNAEGIAKVTKELLA